MAEYVLTATKSSTRPGSFYDRIERFYDLTFKLNGYGRSLDQYFQEHPLPVFPNARILDAGCGTGTLTLALLRTLKVPVQLTALDLSASSMATANEAFDLVVTSGVLEYVSLDDGLSELARVISPGGYLLQLPMRPSPVTTLLEMLFRFKAHPLRDVHETTDRYFHDASHYRFPPFHAIGWSRATVLAQKF